MKVVYITGAQGVKVTYSCSKCGIIFNQRFVPVGIFEEEPDISMIVPVKCPCGERQLMSMEGECELTLHPDDDGIGPQKASFVRYIPTSVEVSCVNVPTVQEVDPDAEI